MSGAGAPPSAAELRAAMVRRVMSDAAVTGWAPTLAPWCDALAQVPRHLFIPATIWVRNPDGGRPALVRFRRDEDPARWLRISYGGEGPGYVFTQVDDGHPDGPDHGGTVATSSASDPVIVAIMLAALDARPGERVLEIGTGTGYNAALLAHRLGVEHVTTIEVDPVVADTAAHSLRANGYGGICAVVGDGAEGYLPGAPYDRVIATVAVREIPHAWIEQSRPGGRVLVPWRNTYTSALVALTVNEDGCATGSIVDDASFMWLRTQREGGAAALVNDDEEADAERGVTDLHPYWVGGDRGARFAVGQRVPGCQYRYLDEDDGSAALWLLDFESRSWAKLTHQPATAADMYPVLQHGPRRLLDEVYRAHQWWVSHDRPGVDRWRFTVRPGGQEIELTE